MAEPHGFYTDTTVCIGCKACQVACHQWNDLPAERTHTAQKCTLCYDRLKQGLPPACAQACPTKSIRFGKIVDLKEEAKARVAQLHRLGQTKARLYGADDKVLGGLNSFYLLMDEPEVYGLPSNPKVPSQMVPASLFWSLFTGLLVALGVLFRFRMRTKETPSAAAPPGGT